jgi:hypothetical protein
MLCPSSDCRFGPEADSCAATTMILLNHLVDLYQQRGAGCQVAPPDRWRPKSLRHAIDCEDMAASHFVCAPRMIGVVWISLSDLTIFSTVAYIS